MHRREISMSALRDRFKQTLARYKRALPEDKDSEATSLTERDVLTSILGKRNRAQLET